MKRMQGLPRRGLEIRPRHDWHDRVSKAGQTSEDYFHKNPRVAWPQKRDLLQTPTKYTDKQGRTYHAPDPKAAYYQDWISDMKTTAPKEAAILWVAIPKETKDARELPVIGDVLELTDPATTKRFRALVLDGSTNKYPKQRKTGFVILYPVAEITV